MADLVMQSLPAPVRIVAAGLSRLGWEVRSVEIDMIAETARIELKNQSLLVTFDARNGKATTTRETIGVRRALAGRRGDRFIAERLHVSLIGRHRHEGVRSGLRWLAGYVEQNSERPARPGEVRELFRGLLLLPRAAEGGTSD